MKWSILINLVIVAVIGYVICPRFEESPRSLQPMPERCRLNNLMLRQCCVFPPFFTREIARECGAVFKLNDVYNESKVATLRREILTGCSYWTCVLDKYNLLTTNYLLNDDKYFAHLDRWVDLNLKFADVMLNAKVYCKMTFRVMLPLKMCEFRDFQYCIRNYIKMNCPSLIPIPECRQQKEFFDDCKEYYY